MARQQPRVSQPLGLASVVACVLITIVRGLNPIAMKVVLLSMPPLLGAFWRISFATIGIACYAALRGIQLRPKRREVLPLTVLAVIFAVQIGANQFGADYTSPVLLAILFNSYPISTAVISSFTVAADRLTLRRVVGLAVAFAGVAWILATRTESRLAPNPVLGNALVLTAATLLSIRMVYTRQLSLKVEYVRAVFWTLIGALPIFLAGWLVIPDPMQRTEQNWMTWTALLFQGLVIGCTAQLAWVYLIRRHTPSTVIAFSFITPISGVVLSSAYFGEAVPGRLVAGLVAVLTGIALATRHSKPGPRASAAVSAALAKRGDAGGGRAGKLS
ncbi:MAG: DMT family transporter [Bryobacterales bacterium]|nr:DMT family transporter [Bryobacterales bacterium]